VGDSIHELLYDWVATCCSVLQSVAACCSVLQCQTVLSHLTLSSVLHCVESGNTYMHIYTYICMHVYIFTCVCVCIYIYIYIYVCVYI